MKICVVILLQMLNLMQFQPGVAFEWTNFATRFARLSREAKEKGSFSLVSIEELKVDMIKACKKGELKEFTGYEGFSDAFSIPTQFYYLPNAPEKGKTYFLLPQIVCEEGNDDASQGPKKPEVTIPDLGVPPFSPRMQIQGPIMPAYTPGWQGFESRFAVIFQNAKDHNGYLTIGGKLSLEELKIDMIKACGAGELVEVGSGSNFVQDVLIATKEYTLPLSSDSQKVNLPAVDCIGSYDRMQIERKSQQQEEDKRKKTAEDIIRAKNLIEEMRREEATKKVQPIGWRGFRARYDVISENAYNNYGYLTSEDLTDLDRLRIEIIDACKAGEIIEFGPGDDIKDELGIVVIPTKEYVLSLTADSEKLILPAIDCHGSYLQGLREKEAEKSLQILKEELMKEGLLIQL